MTKTFKIIWKGDAHMANTLFGENYGTDWAYIPGGIKVGDMIILDGTEIRYNVTVSNQASNITHRLLP